MHVLNLKLGMTFYLFCLLPSLPLAQAQIEIDVCIREDGSIPIFPAFFVSPLLLYS